jgi:SAM-dependent methyltransferase
MLARSGIDALAPGTWADLGCGDGVFTVALATLLAPGSTVHAVDRDAAVLARIPPRHAGVEIVTRQQDMASFTAGGRLDGVLMANSLHYVNGQPAFIRAWAARLAPPYRFVIVEYDTEASNPWVPFPISRARLPSIFGVAEDAIHDLGRRPSIYRRAPLYAALVLAPPQERLPGSPG